MQREILSFHDHNDGMTLIASRDVDETGHAQYGGLMFDDPFDPKRLVRVEFPLADEMKSDRDVFGAFLFEFSGEIRKLTRMVIAGMPPNVRGEWNARRLSKVIAEQVEVGGKAAGRVTVIADEEFVEVPEIRLVGFMIWEATPAVEV